MWSWYICRGRICRGLICKGLINQTPTINVYRIIFIVVPFRRVVDNVSADAIHFFFTADDVLVKIALPEFAVECRPIFLSDAIGILMCCYGFECTDNITQCRGRSCACPGSGIIDLHACMPEEWAPTRGAPTITIIPCT